VEIQFAAKIKNLKTDKGSEYVNKEMNAFLEIMGIMHDLSPPYTNEGNDIPEPLNRF
jgi:hypothetical protein